MFGPPSLRYAKVACSSKSTIIGVEFYGDDPMAVVQAALVGLGGAVASRALGPRCASGARLGLGATLREWR